MVDFLTPTERSLRMSKVRSKDTAPELALRSALHSLGFRFRIHARKLPGSPDIVMPKYKTVIMVHGCYWHRHHGCRLATTPKSNTRFWIDKFDRNVLRDQQALDDLRALGWSVETIWQCEISSTVKLVATTEQLATKLRARGSSEGKLEASAPCGDDD